MGGRKRLPGNHPKRAYLVEWREGRDPHQAAEWQYRRWLKMGAITFIDPKKPRRAKVCEGFTFRFHEDVGAVIFPSAIAPTVSMFCRIVEKMGESNCLMSAEDLQEWICKGYHWWLDRK